MNPTATMLVTNGAKNAVRNSATPRIDRLHSRAKKNPHTMLSGTYPRVNTKVLNRVCVKRGSSVNIRTKFSSPMNSGGLRPLQRVSEAYIETRIGKSWKPTTPTTTGEMNSQPSTFCEDLMRRSARESPGPPFLLE